MALATDYQPGTYTSPNTGKTWSIHPDGRIDCTDCGGREQWPCPDCGGALNATHWCERDEDAQRRNAPPEDYCWCDRCDNTGHITCPTCSD